MSIQDFEQAQRLMAIYPILQDFEGPKSEDLLLAAERAIGEKFPFTYRRFLRQYGAGAFGSSEIYGVIHQNFENSSIPDSIWYTLQLRQKQLIPLQLIVIYDLGDGELFCLDLDAMKGGEAPVVTFTPGGPLNQQRELIAEDFGQFFLDLIQQEISYVKNKS